jgi:hypothetical protein
VVVHELQLCGCGFCQCQVEIFIECHG